jgi:hypothetical protein
MYSVLHEITRMYEKLSLNVELYPAIIMEEEEK